tara:strand:+ start:78 stop:260 length:183 start_codon:yes stop_codon:yes gene_type:complete
MIGSEATDDTINILTAGVTNPAFIIAFVEIYREFALVMITVGALKKIFIVGPIIGPQNIS